MEQRARSFGWFVTAWLLAFGVYLIALIAGGPQRAEAVNNIAWTLAPMFASIACSAAARTPMLAPQQRRAWRIMALACASWLVGQLIWLYYAFVLGSEPAFPSPSKIFFLGYAALMVLALRGLADSSVAERFTMQHLGNLGLIGCCLAVTLVLAFLEPVLQPARTDNAIVGSLVHSTLVATTFFAALYYLWSKRWHSTWPAMLLLVCATGVHTLGNFIYVHALLSKSYRVDDWVNITWVMTFLLIGLAAHRRATVSTSALADPDVLRAVTRRSRLLEAIVPALLIVTMVVVGMSVTAQLSPRVLVTTAVLLLTFAVILGAREAWTQGESQRLTLELRETNERMRGTNLELQHSEARVRDLNVHLEERVAQRTRQLQLAYEELEGFAYAVAHDLKAPLRAIDGFGQLLVESLAPHADERSTAYLSRIRRSATKMSSLIEDLLAYSRIERRTLAQQSIDLRQAIDDVLAECAHDIDARNVSLVIDVPAIRLTADTEALALVIRNLVQNALKFTRTVTAPRIEVSARHVSATPAPPGVAPPESAPHRAEQTLIEIAVRDNGIGFDMQYHEQIFRLFHRLHRDDQYPGNGIGLPLVRKALERMQGTVRAESRAGEGATFIVLLNARSPSIAGP